MYGGIVPDNLAKLVGYPIPSQLRTINFFRTTLCYTLKKPEAERMEVIVKA